MQCIQICIKKNEKQLEKEGIFLGREWKVGFFLVVLKEFFSVHCLWKGVWLVFSWLVVFNYSSLVSVCMNVCMVCGVCVLCWCVLCYSSSLGGNSIGVLFISRFIYIYIWPWWWWRKSFFSSSYQRKHPLPKYHKRSYHAIQCHFKIWTPTPTPAPAPPNIESPHPQHYSHPSICAHLHRRSKIIILLRHATKPPPQNKENITSLNQPLNQACLHPL